MSTNRLEFIQDYTLKSLRLKQDKWNKLVISDEQRGFLHSFVDQGFPQELVISQNIGGQLQVHTDWPSPLKNKGVFFVKREKVPLPEQISDLLSWMCCGDIHPNPLGIDRHSLTVASTSLFRSVLWDSGGGLQPNIQLLRQHDQVPALRV